MSMDYFEEEQLMKSRRKRELERRKRDNLAMQGDFRPRRKSKRRNRTEIRHTLKQWDDIGEELEYELLTDH